jgi:hypothetical protein
LSFLIGVVIAAAAVFVPLGNQVSPEKPAATTFFLLFCLCSLGAKALQIFGCRMIPINVLSISTFLVGSIYSLSAGTMPFSDLIRLDHMSHMSTLVFREYITLVWLASWVIIDAADLLWKRRN